MRKWYNQTLMVMAVIKCRLFNLMCMALSICSCTSGTQKEQTETLVIEKPKYEVYTVDIKDMKFVPDTLTVKKGDKIYFVNRDLVNHCVTELKSKAWTSGNIPPNETYLLVANTSTDYYCGIHTVMKGRIVVQDK